MATWLVSILFLSSFLAVSGMVTASQGDNSSAVRMVDQSQVEMTFGTITLGITEVSGGYEFSYRQASMVTRLSVMDSSDVVKVSINGGEWEDVRTLLEQTSFSSIEPTASVSGEESFSPLSYRTWWDGVRFVKGYPAVYPHPDRDYYGIFAKRDWDRVGVRLVHYQFGTAVVGLLANLGPFAIGAAIGAAVGSAFAPGVGTIVGAIVGSIIGGILSYAYNVAFVDEVGTIWWWINRSLLTALSNAPWWLWWCGPCMQAYIANNIDYLRVGSLTGHNELRIRGP